MLHIPEIQPEVQNSSAAPHVTTRNPVRTVTGRRLNRLVKKGSPRDRALLAYDLERGAVQLVCPTRVQAVGLTRATAGYVNTLARLSEDERLRVARGETSISRLHTHWQLTDNELDRLVERCGVEALWRALERATAPDGVPAE